MQSPSSRRYELAAVAALVTPMVVPVPRLIPSPTNKVSSEQASRAIDSSCVCFPPSPVSRVHPHTVCRDRSSEETGAEPARSGAAHGHAFAWKEPAGQGGSPHFTVPVCPHPAASTADTRGEYAAGKLAERSVVSTFEHCELRAANGSASSAAPTSPMAVLHATGEYAPACTSATWSQCAARGPGPLPASTNNRLQETLGKNQETDPSVARVPRSACPDPALEQADAQYTTRLLVEGKVPHPLAGDQNCSIKGGLSAVSRVNTSENLFEAWSKSEAMTDAASVCLSDSKHAAQGFPWDSPGEPAALPAGYTLPASFSQWQENPPASPGWFAASPGNGEDVSVLPKHSGADAEECRVRALLRELQQLQLHPTSLKPRDVVFRSSFTDGMRGELQYQVIEEGSFGKVFAGSLTRRPEQKVAIKVPVEAMLKVDPAGVMERFTNEWKILAACEHPGIVGLVGGVVHGPFDVWVVTNLVENGHDLHSRKYSRDPAIRREISPQAALSMCRQLASIVAYLHTPLPEAGKSVIVHRDIKPENVIVNDEWLIQLCDFGDAEASVDGRVSRVSGATWFYAPPELLQSSPVERAAGTFVSDPDTHGHGAGAAGQTGEPVFSEKWDIWSMGCVFHEMFGFQNPFHTYVSPTDPPESIYEKLKSRAQQNALVPAIDSRIQGLAREVITKCLNPNPEDRPSAEDVFRMWASADDLILKDVRLDVSGNLLHEREIPSSVSEHQVPSGAEAKAEVAAPDRGSNLTTPPDARYPASAPDFFRQLQPFSGGTEPGLAPDERRFGGDPAMESAQLIQGSRLSLAYGDALSAGTGLPMGSCGALSTDCKSRSAVGPESRARLIAAPVENLLSCGRQTVAAERWSLSCAPPPFHRGSSESHQQRLRDSAEPRNFGFEPAAPVGPEGHIQHTQGKRAPVDVVTPGVVGEEGPRAAMNVDSYATSCAGDQGYARWGVKTTGGQRPILGSGPGGARVRSVGVGGDGFVSVPNLAVVSAASGDFVC
ncbi:putative protein kinase [Neospora caninum Liverpool]|uniref:Protein kinase domain-containing protein n=1 Tax=Neospora caninum (strain Liverpool) TaxID=572307 RepID=F0VHZ5_NEOCL|nr:putative protein kinase [Neospora caninum Liverpool]CBZ53356.1 putative protein kinase [Neospora caninum Liverpool]|eukprot:XP_003883388.1 putative protein kinase [Neospora caninum Liverpool]